jgi:hypothetical protein
MATFGKRWSEGGPWSREASVHQIKGGASRANRGAGRTGSLKATQPQIDFLLSLGYEHDPRDRSRLEASDAIEILKRRRSKRRQDKRQT